MLVQNILPSYNNLCSPIVHHIKPVKISFYFFFKNKCCKSAKLFWIIAMSRQKNEQFFKITSLKNIFLTFFFQWILQFYCANFKENWSLRLSPNFKNLSHAKRTVTFTFPKIVGKAL